MLPTGCLEAGRFTLTQSSWTVLAHCSGKWMSGQAAALAPTKRFDGRQDRINLALGSRSARAIIKPSTIFS
jgi:hypothetical protein